MAQIKVLIIEPSGETREAEIDNDLGAFQAIVGGYIEPVYGRVGTIYVNEEGLLRQLPFNPAATMFAIKILDQLGIRLFGTVFIVGPADTEGDDTDVRPAVVDYFKEN